MCAFATNEAMRRATVRHTLTPEERDAQAKRRTIGLALARAKADLALAVNEAHRRMLTEAIAALERQLGG